MDDPVFYRVGPETMDDLIKVVEQLGEFLKWLGEKEDLDAALKFAPIVQRIDGLINAILAANEPEFAPWVDLMEKIR